MRTRRARHRAHTPIIYECERCLRLNASADTVWGWMADVRRLLSLNIFHVAVAYSEPVMQVGLRVPILHHVWGLYRQTRIARIRAYRKYFVAWGEFQEHGIDRFPHSQSFTLVPIEAQSCLVINRLRGQFRIPGARYWFLPLYCQLAPRILEFLDGPGVPPRPAACPPRQPARSRRDRTRILAHSALWAGLQGEYRCPSRQSSLGRKCLNLNQKKCKFLYDQDNALRAQQPDVLHPVVRTHPFTGQKCLYVSQGECAAIAGMEDDLAVPLIEELATCILQSQFQYTHTWQVHDVLMWDNCSVQHLATFDYHWPQHRRLMHRITVGGSQPF